MDKRSFYNIGHREEGVPADSVKNITNTVSMPDVSDATISSEAPQPYTQGENIMAEVDTQMLSGQHADIRREAAEHASDIRFNVAERAGDIRREQAAGFGDTRYNIAERAGDIRREAAEHTNEIVKEGLKESFNIRGDVKDTRHDVLREVDRQADRLDNQATQFYIAGQQNANESARDLASLKTLTDANTARFSVEMALSIEKVGAANALQAEKIASASALGAEKIASAVALGQSQLSKEIFHDGQKTRDLINDLKYHDLNRGLVERNTALVSAEDNHRHYRDRWMDGRFDQNQAQFQGQWAQLQSQIQAFQSQLQETRQGMVNFGTMSGQSGQQTSTSNNVR